MPTRRPKATKRTSRKEKLLEALSVALGDVETIERDVGRDLSEHLTGHVRSAITNIKDAIELVEHG